MSLPCRSNQSTATDVIHIGMVLPVNQGASISNASADGNYLIFDDGIIVDDGVMDQHGACESGASFWNTSADCKHLVVDEDVIVDDEVMDGHGVMNEIELDLDVDIYRWRDEVIYIQIRGPELAGARCTGEDEEASAGDVPGRSGEVTAIPLVTRTSRGTSSSCGGDAGDVPGQPGEVTARQLTAGSVLVHRPAGVKLLVACLAAG